jgi:PHD/YefM family antitoxin component YafN of YafNO toxin-antitoxin module
MITANELKVKGIKAIQNELKDKDEAVITHRGKPKFIVVDFDRFDKLRGLELDKAYLEAMEDIKAGRYKTVSVDEHIQEVMSEL